MTDNEADLDQKIGKRYLVIEVEDETGHAEVDFGGFAAWEAVGLAAFLEQAAHELLQEEDE